MGRLRVGTMGWSYDFWVGNFYPTGVDARELLTEYSKRFDTVEVDSTFYRIPSPRTIESWSAQTPDDFVFSAKFPRTITHEKMLKGCEEETMVFIERVSALGEKLGPLLLQFPYGFKPEMFDGLKEFLEALPRGHRYAVEVRNKRWLGERLYSLLKDSGVALAIVDHPWLPEVKVITADFAYLRWEGDRRKVNGTLGRMERDRGEDIRRWANKVKKLMLETEEVYGYFSKHYSGHPPTDVQRILGFLDESNHTKSVN